MNLYVIQSCVSPKRIQCRLKVSTTPRQRPSVHHPRPQAMKEAIAGVLEGKSAAEAAAALDAAEAASFGEEARAAPRTATRVAWMRLQRVS